MKSIAIPESSLKTQTVYEGRHLLSDLGTWQVARSIGYGSGGTGMHLLSILSSVVRSDVVLPFAWDRP